MQPGNLISFDSCDFESFTNAPKSKGLKSKVTEARTSWCEGNVARSSKKQEKEDEDDDGNAPLRVISTTDAWSW